LISFRNGESDAEEIEKTYSVIGTLSWSREDLNAQLIPSAVSILGQTSDPKSKTYKTKTSKQLFREKSKETATLG
jgi:hypothetical protein